MPSCCCCHRFGLEQRILELESGRLEHHVRAEDHAALQDERDRLAAQLREAADQEARLKRGLEAEREQVRTAASGHLVKEEEGEEEGRLHGLLWTPRCPLCWYTSSYVCIMSCCWGFWCCLCCCRMLSREGGQVRYQPYQHCCQHEVFGSCARALLVAQRMHICRCQVAAAGKAAAAVVMLQTLAVLLVAADAAAVV